MEFLLQPETYISLVTLTFLEIVLGHRQHYFYFDNNRPAAPGKPKAYANNRLVAGFGNENYFAIVYHFYNSNERTTFYDWRTPFFGARCNFISGGYFPF